MLLLLYITFTLKTDVMMVMVEAENFSSKRTTIQKRLDNP